MYFSIDIYHRFLFEDDSVFVLSWTEVRLFVGVNLLPPHRWVKNGFVYFL